MAWLGASASIRQSIEKGNKEIHEENVKIGRFSLLRIGMLEMVFSKTDTWLSEHYDLNLVKKELWYLGQSLREQLQADIKLFFLYLMKMN